MNKINCFNDLKSMHDRLIFEGIKAEIDHIGERMYQITQNREITNTMLNDIDKLEYQANVLFAYIEYFDYDLKDFESCENLESYKDALKFSQTSRYDVIHKSIYKCVPDINMCFIKGEGHNRTNLSEKIYHTKSIDLTLIVEED